MGVKFKMNSILTHLSNYIENNLYDVVHGAFYTSVNRNKDDIVTEDKTLLDLSLGILAFSKQNNFKMVQSLLKDLELFRDNDNGGFYEILDGTSIRQEVGEVKTFYIQILVQYSIYVSSLLTDNKSSEDNSRKNIENIVKQYIIQNKSSIVSSNWEKIIDSSIRLRDLSIILYVLTKAHVGGFDDILVPLLQKFFDKNKGAYSALNASEKPEIGKGKKLLDMSLMVIALENSKEKYKNKFRNTIDETVYFIDQHYRHPLTGGFWDKSDENGKVSVDVITSYYHHLESPFPIKSMLSHLIFLLALKSISNTSNRELVENMQYEVKQQVLSYYDLKNGGINLGQGNWFSTPISPTVPIARHVMVPPHTPGAFYVGNTAYLPMHEKLTTLQLLGLLILDQKDTFPTTSFPKLNYDKSVFNEDRNFSLNSVTSGPLTSCILDIENYKKWSRKTISGFSYGLTAYKSPLGIKSDKTPQNFSALHVVADMTLLGEEIPNKEQLEISMTACQNSDGGFGEQPSLLSELFTTYCVVATEFILENTNYNINKCIQFVQECQNEDGGFGNAPGYPSDAWHTNFGAVTLHLLKAEPYNKEALIQYLLNCQDDNGGFSVIPDGVPEVFSTFRCIDSLLVQGVEIPNKKKLINWVQSLQSSDGGFLYQEDKLVSFVGSYHAIGALYLLGETPLNPKRAQEWIADHQSKDGGFSRAISAPSDTTDEGFISIHASYMLEKKVSPYWVAIIT